MTGTDGGGGLRNGSVLGVAVALAVTLVACAIPGGGPVGVPGAAAPGVAAVGSALDRAFDANIAEVEHFIDLGGRVADTVDGLLLLDADGTDARTELVALATHLADTLGIDPAIVDEAIAAAGSGRPDRATGLATGTAERDGVVLICTSAHGGITLGFDDRRA
ncbi:hypothetical protein [Demequina maris]|uniref:hypothetical protein n=1 Tax=Demequina maris TaxID=1638982 RepID=UPI0007827B12|nr:hypothetical protein [Demequina maris]